METSGRKGRVHLSEQTAKELIKHGKQDWIVAREDIVEAKGKGKLNTFWFKHRADSINALSANGLSESNESESVNSSKCETHLVAKKQVTPAKVTKETMLSQPVDRMQRIIDWNSELLLELLRLVVARRPEQVLNGTEDLTSIARQMGSHSMVVEEVAEIIEMPPFLQLSSSYCELSDKVVAQLRQYVAKLATMYNDNPCKYEN
jgi:hypothetical protein